MINPLQRLNTKYSLLFATLLLGVTLLVLGLSGYLVFQRTNDLRVKLVQSFSSIYATQDIEALRKSGTYLSNRLFNPLFNVDLSTLNGELEQIRSWLEPRSIFVLDAKGQVVTDGTFENESYGQVIKVPQEVRPGNPVIVPMAEGKQLYFVIGYANELAGYAFVELSNERSEQLSKVLSASVAETWNSFYNAFLIIALFSICLVVTISVLIGWGLSSSLSRPIREMIKAAELYAEGNLNYKLQERSQDELGRLAQALNKMADDLYKMGRLLDRAQEMASFGSWEWRRGKDGLVFSNGIYKIFGVTNQVFPPTVQHLLKFVEPDMQERLSAILQGRFQESVSTEFQIHRLDGEIRTLLIRSEPSKADNGIIDGFLGIIHDITEQKRSDEEREKLQAQLTQAQKMETIGTLAGGIAHDFNNILFPILGYTEMMLSEVSDDNPMHESLKKIYSGGMRAAALVKQILTFSRQEPHHLNLLRIQPIIKESLKLLRSTIPTTININQNINENSGLIKADPTHVHQVIMNLVTNAYHAMQEKGGELGVSLEEIKLTKTDLINAQMSSGNYLCLKVSDTGSGMDKVLQDKIFDPFFTTKEKGKGTGMGLSVVHGIVTQMRGAIDVNSEPGRGTVFKVYLPVEKGKIVEQTSQSESNLKAGNESILVVDDDKAVLDMEKNMLERLGYQVTARTSSIEALEAFRADPDKFDAVITDMTMPNMTGDQLSRKVMEIKPEIPVIICTGFSERIDPKKAKTIGVKCLLMKPVIISELSQQLRSVLDESEDCITAMG